MALDYFDGDLLKIVKRRMFAELTDTVQKHSNYRDKVKVYHKFPYKERPMFGVVLKNASGGRMPLSADDYAATMSSHVGLARAKGYEGRLLKWVWEDELAVTKIVGNEDLSSQLSGTPSVGTNRVFTVAEGPIMAGQNTSNFADNFRQISVVLNGERTMAEFVDGEKGVIILPTAPPSDSSLTVSYWKKNIVPAGRYYLELISNDQFVVDPLYIVKKEEVISKATGTETTASLSHDNLLENYDYLYTKRYEASHNIYLERGTDYTIDTDGLITFLNPLPAGTTLYANYRWIGDRLGPFDMPTNDFQYNNTALPGVVLAFGSERIVGDKNVIIVNPKREVSAKVYSGHFTMNFEVDVMSRDTVQLPELTDYIVFDMWSTKKVPLTLEGLTLESIEPTGEFEEVYDQNTGDQYYKNSVSIAIMTEWKRFIPYLSEIEDYTYDLTVVAAKQNDYMVTKDGRVLQTTLLPFDKPFEVKYPESGRVRYF